ncbi:myogenesis-regulating glycosidase-like isoform X2 [Amphibalanus amphitrite]|uniref:myogenesis-regulating glycosidase-like isoform X2 n=1 Tax=Amphibalanus amphitrite TaxID=1232801 RepID=UPI001C91F336|nr:myogenesis-regulating glycosidase-like isoform X2 [Amphibalanus amphitrite]
MSATFPRTGAGLGSAGLPLMIPEEEGEDEWPGQLDHRRRSISLPGLDLVAISQREPGESRRMSNSDGALLEGSPDDSPPPPSDSDSGSQAASKPSSLQGSLDGKDSDYTDTICSTRSDFFKRYYAPNSPARADPAVDSNGYTPLRPTAGPAGQSGQPDDPPPSKPDEVSAEPSVEVKKPPAKKSRLKGWASQVRFSWVAMALLFTVIIASIVVIVLQYNIHKSKYALLGRFKFSEQERRLRLLSPEGEEQARIFIASEVPSDDLPYDCGLHRSTRVSHTSKYLAESTSQGRGVCLEWKNQARVTLEQVSPERLNCSGPVCRGIQCFRVDWRSLSPTVDLMDCLSLKEPAGQTWYGSAESAAADSWPLGTADQPLAPLVTGDTSQHAFGNVVQRSFLSSNGVGVYTFTNESMFVRVDVTEGRLCLGNVRRPFPYRYPAEDHLTMLYSICTAPNIMQMHQFGTHVLNPYSRRIEETRRKVWPSFDQIVYHFPGGGGVYTQDQVIAYGADISNRRYGSGVLVLDSHWQAHQGDIQFDRKRFSNAWKANELLQRQGLELAVTISPVVELKSANIEYGIDKQLWVREAVTGDPALVNLANAKGAWMDLSSTKTQNWLRTKLKRLKDETKIKWVVIDQTSAQLLPFYYNLTQRMANPDYLSEQLHAVVRQAGLLVLSTSSAVRPLQEPVFAQLSPRPSTWAGLRQVLPSALAAGTGGLHLVAPPAVGGSGAAEPELYARWLQLASFMPRVHLAQLPHQLSPELEQMANTLLWRRRRTVLPAYKAALREALAEGWPMVRPLWHQFGEDPTVAPIADQFLIGARLMVAPVTEPNVTSRRVYLPRGLWRELSSGRLDSGGRWLEQPVTIDTIPHYELFEPDDQ